MRKKRNIWLFVVVLLAISLLYAWYERSISEDGIVIHVIDVGQADCAVIESPDGNVIIDTGTDASEHIVRAYLQSHGLTSFSYMILSHPHDDHIGNADMILREFEVERVICAENESETPIWLNFLRLMEEQILCGDLVWVKPDIGDVFWIGALRIEVLMSPSKDNPGENNDSLLLRTDYGDCSMLWTGDAEHKAEEAFLSNIPVERLCVDFLKVAHHGGSGSSSEPFLQAVRPQLAVISCGQDNSFGHPHEETLRRLEAVGSQIYRTDLHGSFRFFCNGKEFLLISSVHENARSVWQ